jgi:hypothetical protein
VTGGTGVVSDGTGGVWMEGTWTAGAAGSVVPSRDGVDGVDGESAAGATAAGVKGCAAGALGASGTRDRDARVVADGDVCGATR